MNLRKFVKRHEWLKRICKKILKHLDFVKLNIFEIVHVHTYDKNKKVRRIYLFGKLINPPRDNLKNKKHIFYFKINRDTDYSLICIQHWINSINKFEDDYDFYFVCDNKVLERKIARFICFKDKNIKFIPSMGRKINHVAENLYTSYWRNATYAHLTLFYHAKKNGIKRYWAIDGDDTLFCTDPDNVASVIQKVEELAIKQDYTAISLDMWRSRTHGKHWSLGVVFLNDNNDLCHYFEDNKDKTWMDYYKGWDNAFNVDWFFNYLKDHKNVSVETFFVNNCYFIHWGLFFRNPIGCSICNWKDTYIEFPIFTGIFKNENLGKLQISKDAIKINVGLDLSEGISFIENEVTNLRFFTPELRQLHCLGDFGKNSKYFY